MEIHISTPEPRGFAAEWVRAWNACDVDAVLAHFADDVIFTSPTATRVIPQSGGAVRGKNALRRYWSSPSKETLTFTLIW